MIFKFLIPFQPSRYKRGTGVFLLSAPDQVVEHEANQRVLQGPEVTLHSCVAVHQVPGFAPEETL